MTHPERLFLDLVERHGNELRLHCYRMLGSSHDSDDMLQETVTRAWRAREQLEDPEHARAWLYRIATNVCLDELSRRRRRGIPSEAGPPAVEANPEIGPPDPEAWLEPCPDIWLRSDTADAGARYEMRESVALAFIAALHHLTPIQRATLLLRDVVGFSGEETSRALGVRLEAANSALFRARAAVESCIAGKDDPAYAMPSAEQDALLERYLRAWNDLDLATFVGLLHDEVTTTMPPAATWIGGRATNVAFYSRMFAAQRKDSFRTLPIAANGQPAFAFYRATADGEPFRLRAIQLVTVRDRRVANIDHFMLPDLHRVFGLRLELDDRATIVADVRPCVDLAAAAIRAARDG